MALQQWLRFPATLVLALPLCAGPGDKGYFTSKVYPVLQKAGCPACHNHDGVASGTKLHFPEAEAQPDQIDNFGKSLLPLIDRSKPEQSLLLNKPTKRIAHAGGQRIAPGSADEAILKEWVEYLATVTPSATAPEATASVRMPVPTEPVLRRLTHAQYNNTIRDLLGDDSRLASQFPPEDFINGFKNQFQGQSISPLLAENYSAAAEKLAKNAFRNGDTHHLIPCKAAGPADVKCRDQFIQSFGKRAFRRPVSNEEAARYAKLFVAEAAAGKSFLAGAQIVVEAMLQSPSFLLRTENGDVLEWIPYETASRLSYFLWNTMPDEALMRDAEAGELDTPEKVERVARRMLKDERAREAVDEFIAQWLRFDRVTGMVKDRRIFPMFTSELGLAMTEETRRLAADLVWNNDNFMKLFSADYTFLNSELAALYQLQRPAAEFGRTPLPQASGRAGIFGHALFLAATSKPEETSPTARGLFVREQFLCQEVPPPPPGVNTNLPALSKDKPKTHRERLAMHTVNESCASCHSLIDPIGFGLEKYDALGQYREKLKITFFSAHGEAQKKPETVELPLDSDGFIAGIPNSQFSSPRTLGEVLAGSAQCQECVVKQLFRYATGHRETFAERPMIQQMAKEFRTSQFRFQDLMISLIKWTIFPTGGGANAISRN